MRKTKEKTSTSTTGTKDKKPTVGGGALGPNIKK